MQKVSELVRGLEDSIESLRANNQVLSRELKARVEQVENLQDTLKKITKENMELQDKLEKCGCSTKKCAEKCARKDNVKTREEMLEESFHEIFHEFLDKYNF